MSNGMINNYAKRRKYNKPNIIRKIYLMGRPFKFNEFDYVLAARLYKRIKMTSKDERAGNDMKDFASSLLMQAELLFKTMKEKVLQEEGED